MSMQARPYAVCQRIGIPRPSRIYSVHQYSKYDSGDVIVVGAGVVGLFVASRLLQRGLSVVVLESAQGLCGGATGAGQGYIWQSHRDPLALGAWKMAQRSPSFETLSHPARPSRGTR